MRPTQYSNETGTHVIRGRILPDKDPYCYASFLIEIRLSPEYPFKRPDLIILDPIYHPNVRDNGSHCCCWGLGDDESWRPTTPLTDCIMAVIRIINNVNSDHATQISRIDEYRYNYETFYRKALEHTLEYGRPRC
jgi:ubiquitin-protein ligase